MERELSLWGVSTHPSTETSWWNPKGEHLKAAPENAGGGHVTASDREKAFEFALRVQGAHTQGITTQVKFDPRPGSTAGGAASGKDGVWLLRQATTFGTDVSSCAIMIGVANGKWTTLGETAPHGQTVLGTGLGNIEFAEPVEADGKTRVVVAHSVQNRDVRAIAVDANGNEISVSSSGSSGGSQIGMLTNTFDSPLKGIKNILFQTRPFEWVTFKDVALAPAETGSAGAVNAKSDVSSSAKPASTSVGAPDVASVAPGVPAELPVHSPFSKFSFVTKGFTNKKDSLLLERGVECKLDETAIKSERAEFDRRGNRFSFTGAVTLTAKDGGTVHADQCAIGEGSKARFSGNVSLDSGTTHCKTQSLVLDLQPGSFDPDKAITAPPREPDAGSAADAVSFKATNVSGAADMTILEGQVEFDTDDFHATADRALFKKDNARAVTLSGNVVLAPKVASKKTGKTTVRADHCEVDAEGKARIMGAVTVDSASDEVAAPLLVMQLRTGEIKMEGPGKGATTLSASDKGGEDADVKAVHANVVEGAIVMDRALSLPLESGMMNPPAEPTRLRFSKQKDELLATVYLAVKSWPYARWRAHLELLDQNGKVVSNVIRSVQTQRFAVVAPYPEVRELWFPAFPADQQGNARRFRFSMESVEVEQDGPFRIDQTTDLHMNLDGIENPNVIALHGFLVARSEKGYAATFNTWYLPSPGVSWIVTIRLLDAQGKEVATGTTLIESIGASPMFLGRPERQIVEALAPIAGDPSAIERAEQFTVRLMRVDAANEVPLATAKDEKAAPSALEKHVSLSMKNTSVSDIAKELTRQTGQKIEVDPSVVAPSGDANETSGKSGEVANGTLPCVELKNVSLREALKAVLTPLKLYFAVAGDTITIGAPGKLHEGRTEVQVTSSPKEAETTQEAAQKLLAKEATVSWPDTTLGAAVDALVKAADINIVVDTRDGVAATTVAAATFEKQPLETILNNLVKPLKLEFAIHSNFVWISTALRVHTESFSELETRYYDVSNPAPAHLDAFVKLLEQRVPAVFEPTTGARLSYIAVQDAGKGTIAAHNTPENLGFLEKLLPALVKQDSTPNLEERAAQDTHNAQGETVSPAAAVQMHPNAVQGAIATGREVTLPLELAQAVSHPGAPTTNSQQIAPVADTSAARTFLLDAAKAAKNAFSQAMRMTLDVRAATEHRGFTRGTRAALPESSNTSVQYMRNGDSIVVMTDQFPVALRDDTGATRQVHKEDRYAWTAGNEWWHYAPSGSGPRGALRITSDRSQRDAYVCVGVPGNEVFGYVPHENGLIYDALLRQDLSRASLSTEEVNGKACKHVSSANANGRFDLWIDSESGYLPRKLLVHKDADSLMNNSKPLKDNISMPTDLDEIYNWFKSNTKTKHGDAFENAGQSLDYLLENVEISKVGSGFFITRADATVAFTYEGKKEMTTKTRIEARDIEIGGKAGLPESYMLYDLPRNTDVIYLDKTRDGDRRYTSTTLPTSKKINASAVPEKSPTPNVTSSKSAASNEATTIKMDDSARTSTSARAKEISIEAQVLEVRHSYGNSALHDMQALAGAVRLEGDANIFIGPEIHIGDVVFGVSAEHFYEPRFVGAKAGKPPVEIKLITAPRITTGPVLEEDASSFKTVVIDRTNANGIDAGHAGVAKIALAIPSSVFLAKGFTDEFLNPAIAHMRNRILLKPAVISDFWARTDSNTRDAQGKPVWVHDQNDPFYGVAIGFAATILTDTGELSTDIIFRKRDILGQDGPRAAKASRRAPKIEEIGFRYTFTCKADDVVVFALPYRHEGHLIVALTFDPAEPGKAYAAPSAQDAVG